jgi:hypothetical protein
MKVDIIELSSKNKKKDEIPADFIDFIQNQNPKI